LRTDYSFRTLDEWYQGFGSTLGGGELETTAL
jgi:hypothetical protein